MSDNEPTKLIGISPRQTGFTLTFNKLYSYMGQMPPKLIWWTTEETFMNWINGGCFI